MLIVRPEALRLVKMQTRCEYCGKQIRTGLAPHHLTTRGMGGGSRLDVAFGLIGLCPQLQGKDCHNRLHMGKIKDEELLAIVAQRERVNPEDIMAAIYLLRRIHPHWSARRIRTEIAEQNFRVQFLVMPYLEGML